jgi:3-methylcrotonyl-CoA carboxylase beta subunit
MYMWPNARISVMGGEQAAGVLAQVRQYVTAAHSASDVIHDNGKPKLDAH